MKICMTCSKTLQTDERWQYLNIIKIDSYKIFFVQTYVEFPRAKEMTKEERYFANFPPYLNLNFTGDPWLTEKKPCENSFHLKVIHTQWQKWFFTNNSTVQFISLWLCPLITLEWNKDSINRVPFKTRLHLGGIFYCTNTHKWKKLFIDADQVHDFFR